MSTIHFLNVLEGDCNIIQHDSGRVSVIDICNGNNDEKALNELLGKVDSLVLQKKLRYKSKKNGCSSKEKFKQIITKTRSDNLLEKVELEKANSLPLPILLKLTKDVTLSSGCAIEAALMNKKTIVLGERGSIYFQRAN